MLSPTTCQTKVRDFGVYVKQMQVSCARRIKHRQ
jgi:hypothetical protein